MAFTNFMVDLETMGVNPNDAILSIGIVPFDAKEKKLGKGFYAKVSLESCHKLGMNIDPSTVMWWLQQDQAARGEFKGNYAHMPITDALKEVTNFIKTQSERAEIDQLKIWGNGSMMDNALLSAAFDLAGLGVPWSYKSDMCYRTLRALAPDVKRVEPEIAHHALSDAVAQAKTLFAINDKLNLDL